jgi:hypothetical protein
VRGLFVNKKGACKNGDVSVWWCGKCGGKFVDKNGSEGPLTREHPDYKGSSYNVKVEWENREIMSEPLNVIATDDPVTCMIYARENALLDLLGYSLCSNSFQLRSMKTVSFSFYVRSCCQASCWLEYFTSRSGQDLMMVRAGCTVR